MAGPAGGSAPEPRAARAAFQDAAFEVGGPAPAGHVFAGEVDHAVDAVEFAGVDLAGIGIPANLTLGVAHLVPHQPPHQVSAVLQLGHEGRAEQTCRSCDSNDHGESPTVCLLSPLLILSAVFLHDASL